MKQKSNTWWRHYDVKKVHFGIKQIFDADFWAFEYQDGNDNPDFTRFRKEFSWSILIFGSKIISRWFLKEPEKILFDQKRTFKPQIRDNFSKQGPFFQKVPILRFEKSGYFRKNGCFRKKTCLIWNNLKVRRRTVPLIWLWWCQNWLWGLPLWHRVIFLKISLKRLQHKPI